MANKYECEGALPPPISSVSIVHEKALDKYKCKHVSRFDSECHHLKFKIVGVVVTCNPHGKGDYYEFEEK